MDLPYLNTPANLINAINFAERLGFNLSATQLFYSCYYSTEFVQKLADGSKLILKIRVEKEYANKLSD